MLTTSTTLIIVALRPQPKVERWDYDANIIFNVRSSPVTSRMQKSLITSIASTHSVLWHHYMWQGVPSMQTYLWQASLIPTRRWSRRRQTGLQEHSWQKRQGRRQRPARSSVSSSITSTLFAMHRSCCCSITHQYRPDKRPTSTNHVNEAVLQGSQDALVARNNHL